jgi:hypothetical protein
MLLLSLVCARLQLCHHLAEAGSTQVLSNLRICSKQVQAAERQQQGQ